MEILMSIVSTPSTSTQNQTRGAYDGVLTMPGQSRVVAAFTVAVAGIPEPSTYREEERQTRCQVV
ncbi:MAG TPA: hypothetical protein EYO39_03855 [Nitrospirales bacterium]|nr:hypothetical protein [Nitrospirales bacterium]